ncbi:MAG: hypothetical protein OEU32_15395, partial [Acidimicrobiia bacterium]|nr:hypothetical protein [Acidimicrobiia bacterium]
MDRRVGSIVGGARPGSRLVLTRGRDELAGPAARHAPPLPLGELWIVGRVAIGPPRRVITSLPLIAPANAAVITTPRLGPTPATITTTIITTPRLGPTPATPLRPARLGPART